MPTVIDRTSQTSSITTSRQAGKPILSRHSRTGRRALDAIDSVILHQTSFSRMGNDAQPDDDYDHTIAHFVVRQNGVILRLRHYDAFLNNSRSRRSISIEFEGNFPNMQGQYYRPDRFGRHSLSPAQAFAGRDLLLLIRRELPSNQIDKIFAHMQFSTLPGRANCPGPHVWYNVGFWATQNLGMRSSGRGARPIPLPWETNQYDVVSGNPY